MSRAGREPAEDVKRRLVAACLEVGQEATAMMRLIGNERIIFVTTATFELIARVPITGTWPETIDVRCGTSDRMFDPCLQGRTYVPFDELVPALRQTLEEREQVIAAMQLGIEGPYRFTNSAWQIPDLGLS